MKKNIKTSILISFFYVLLGTIVVVVSFPEYQILGFNHEHPLWLPLVIFTLPVNILLFGLVMVEFSIFYILILQGIILLLCWTLIYFILKNIKNK